MDVVTIYATEATTIRFRHDRTLQFFISFGKKTMAPWITLEILVFVILINKNKFTRACSAGSLIWSQTHETFIPIENVTAFRFERQNYLSRSRELENYNFQRKALRVTYYEEQNIVHFYDNDTKISGVCGELWNTLATYLNFTMITIRSKDTRFGERLPNGNYSGLLGMLVHNDVQIILRTGYYVAESRAMDYTLPMWYNSYRLYIRSEQKSDGSWVIRMFSRRVWISIFLLFVLLSVLGCAMQKLSMRVSRDKDVHHDLHDHLFHTFATLCCQGFIPDSLYTRIKILGFTKKIFAWLLLITVSSHLISFTTNQKVQPPFEDLDAMFNQTDYNVVVFNGSIIYGKFLRVVNTSGALDNYGNRIFYVKSPQRLYEKGCWGKRRYAVLDSEDRQRAYGRLKCILVATGIPYFSTWVAGGVAKTFKYKRSLDIGILKLHECGLTDRLKDRWLATRVINVDRNVVESVTFDQVSMLYATLLIGMIASAVVFVLENVVFLYSQNQAKVRRKSVYPRGTLVVKYPPERIIAIETRRIRQLRNIRIDLIFQKPFVQKALRR